MCCLEFLCQSRMWGPLRSAEQVSVTNYVHPSAIKVIAGITDSQGRWQPQSMFTQFTAWLPFIDLSSISTVPRKRLTGYYILYTHNGYSAYLCSAVKTDRRFAFAQPSTPTQPPRSVDITPVHTLPVSCMFRIYRWKYILLYIVLKAT